MVAISDFKAFRTELTSFVPDVKVSYQIDKRGEYYVLAEKMDGHIRLVQYSTAKRHKFYSFDTRTLDRSRLS